MPVMEKWETALPPKAANRPESFSRNMPRSAPNDAVVSKGGVTYYPFASEEEVSEWIDNVVSEWWDDETV